ncbi:MAG TPA: ROK family protein [Longimicrobiales bacterium]|nr:ROK family protein [Longimicrobiales bacterium]
MTEPGILALDLGGTKLAGALFTPDGAIRQRATYALDGRQGSEVGALILEAVQQFKQYGPIGSVGVAVPGIYRTATGTVWAPNIPGWDDYPLRAELSAALDGGVACAVESDRTCYILGEVWQGNARGARNAVFLAVGTGIGAGIMVDGRIIRGHADITGAIGWLALDRPYEDGYRECGNFEYYASGPGIARAAQMTTEEVFAARTRDPHARAAIDRAVAYWGMAVANLVSLLNPEVIVFGGGVFGPAAELLDDIYREALQWAQPISIRQVKIVSSALGGDAGLYGAARVALEQLPAATAGIS